MSETNQLLFLLRQRHDEHQQDVSYQQQAAAAAPQHRTSPRALRFEGGIPAAAPLPSRQTRSQTQARHVVKKKQKIQTYMSPFVKKAAEMAKKRLAENSASKKSWATAQQKYYGDDKEKENNNQASNSNRGGGWNFEPRKEALFDPALKKQEIFRIEPKIHEKLPPGAAALARLIAMKRVGQEGTTGEEDESDVLGPPLALSSGKSLTIKTRGTMPLHVPPTTSSPHGAMSPSPPVSLRGSREQQHHQQQSTEAPSPSRNSLEGNEFGREVSRGGNGSKQREHQHTVVYCERSTSPIDERIVASLLGQEHETDDEDQQQYAYDDDENRPLDSSFTYRPAWMSSSSTSSSSRQHPPSHRAPASSSSSNSDMMASMAQVIHAVSDLVSELGGKSAVASPFWAKRRTPARSTSTPRTPGAGMRAASIEEELKDQIAVLHSPLKKPLLDERVQQRRSNSNEKISGGRDVVVDVDGEKSPPVTKSAVLDLLTSKLQQMEQQEQATWAYLTKPTSDWELPLSSTLTGAGMDQSAAAAAAALASKGLQKHQKAQSSSHHHNVASAAVVAPQNQITRVPRSREGAHQQSFLQKLEENFANEPSPFDQGEQVIEYTHFDLHQLETNKPQAEEEYFEMMQRQAATYMPGLKAPRQLATHETSLRATLAAAPSSSSSSSSSTSYPHTSAGSVGVDIGMMNSLLGSSAGRSKAREADVKDHIHSALHEKQRQSVAHLPMLHAPVVFCNEMNDYFAKLKM